MQVYYNNWREMYAAAAKERDELKRMLKDSKPVADLVAFPNCEADVETNMMTREEALDRYDRIRYSLLNHDDKVAVDIAFEALRGE